MPVQINANVYEGMRGKGIVVQCLFDEKLLGIEYRRMQYNVSKRNAVFEVIGCRLSSSVCSIMKGEDLRNMW